jgi:predicted amidophosphoribosyltransferase
MAPIVPRSAPEGGELSVCPHCWHVNPHASRLCARCGADMRTVLQESGGLRHTAPVQSPVPVRARLSPVQRMLVLSFVALFALASLVTAWKGRFVILAPQPPVAPQGATGAAP